MFGYKVNVPSEMDDYRRIKRRPIVFTLEGYRGNLGIYSIYNEMLKELFEFYENNLSYRRAVETKIDKVIESIKAVEEVEAVEAVVSRYFLNV